MSTLERSWRKLGEKLNGKKFENEQEEDEPVKSELDQLTIRLRDRMVRDDRITSIESSGDVPAV
jgi:hypothetical protein